MSNRRDYFREYMRRRRGSMTPAQIEAQRKAIRQYRLDNKFAIKIAKELGIPMRYARDLALRAGGPQ